MDSGSKRLSSPTVKFMTSGITSPTPTILRIKSPNSLLNDNSTIVETSHLNHRHSNSKHNPSGLTPLLTPNRSGSMVLLSPSRTISDSLTLLASSTGQQLEEIWDVVGYTPEDRAAQLSDLLVKFKELCEHKIAEERGVAETFRQTIAESKEEIRRTAAALKTTVDPQLLRDALPGQTLTDELATLEAALEGLRTAANAAKEDLTVCRDYLIEAHDALGLEMDPKWRDVDSDLTVTRQDEFRRKKAEMKEELSTRSAAIIQLVRDCQHLMNDLRIDVEKEGSDLDRRIAGALVRSKDGSFIMASKFRSTTCVGISATAMEELTKRVAELHSEKRRRKAKLQDMGAEIALLWEKLRVPDDEQRAFTESVQGLGIDTIQKGEAELERLHALKSAMLGKLIEETRSTISSLWEQINAAPDQRSFQAFYVTQSLFSEDLLDQHEEYLGSLQGRLEKMKPILRMIERREDIVRERMEYEELQKDSDRLKQRGAALTRQLMEEEKMARRIRKELPRLTDLLTEKLVEWKDEQGEDFLHRGEMYLDVMDRQEEEWKRYKEGEMQRKLKKKQEETLIENRGAKFGHGKVMSHRPLGECVGRENTRQQTTRNRSQELTKQASSHGLGNKQTSTKL